MSADRDSTSNRPLTAAEVDEQVASMQRAGGLYLIVAAWVTHDNQPERTKEHTVHETTTEQPKLRTCSCPVAGCAWKVTASAGYAAPRIDRHLRAAHPNDKTTIRSIDAGARRREEA